MVLPENNVVAYRGAARLNALLQLLIPYRRTYRTPGELSSHDACCGVGICRISRETGRH